MRSTATTETFLATISRDPSRLDRHNSEWIATYLERSKAAPLDVWITKPLPSFDIQDFLSFNLRRTRPLCVELSLQGVRAARFKTHMSPQPRFDACPQLSLPSSLPHLTNFKLSTHPGQLMSLRTLLELLSSAPCLQRVSRLRSSHLARRPRTFQTSKQKESYLLPPCHKVATGQRHHSCTTVGLL